MEKTPVSVVEGGEVLAGGLGVGVEKVWTSSDVSETTLLCVVEVVRLVEGTELRPDLACSPCELPCCSRPEPTSTWLLSGRITISLARLQDAFHGKGAI